MENKFLKAILLICTLTFISCSAQKSDSKATSISFEKIESQSYGGFQEETYYVITDARQLKKIYIQLNLTRKPGLPLPIIDFDKECVIALFMGQRNSGGYAIELDSIINKKESSFDVLIKKIIPTSMVSMAITQPYSIYRLNIQNPKVKFVEKE